jgi:hypothetical protein
MKTATYHQRQRRSTLGHLIHFDWAYIPVILAVWLIYWVIFK